MNMQGKMNARMAVENQWRTTAINKFLKVNVVTWRRKSAIFQCIQLAGAGMIFLLVAM